MATKMEEQSDALYEKVLMAALKSDEGKARIFSQDELLDLNVVDNKITLMKLVQGLADTKLFRFMSLDGKPHVSVRTKDVAGRMRNLTRDELMIYDHIESAGTSGIWTKRIKDRTGIVQSVITKVLKTLESRTLIKPFTNVTHPNQKTYILAGLDPGEGVKGGPWHSDSEYDMELIGVTADAIIHFIAAKSWAKAYIKRERSMSPMPDLPAAQNGPMAGKKRKHSDGDGDIEGMHPKSKRRQSHYMRIETQVPYPAGYQHYPTAASVLHFIKESGFIKTSVDMDETAIQHLLDVLVYDERLEKAGHGYRTVRGVHSASEAMKNMMTGRGVDVGEDGDVNGLTQSPCGRCPVFDLCESGGPINAKNCEYFSTWLKN